MNVYCDYCGKKVDAEDTFIFRERRFCREGCEIDLIYALAEDGQFDLVETDFGTEVLP